MPPTSTSTNDLFNSELRDLLALHNCLVIPANHIPADLNFHNTTVENFARTFLAFAKKYKNNTELFLTPETIKYISREALLRGVMNDLLYECHLVLHEIALVRLAKS